MCSGKTWQKHYFAPSHIKTRRHSLKLHLGSFSLDISKQKVIVNGFLLQWCFMGIWPGRFEQISHEQWSVKPWWWYWAVEKYWEQGSAMKAVERSYKAAWIVTWQIKTERDVQEQKKTCRRWTVSSLLLPGDRSWYYHKMRLMGLDCMNIHRASWCLLAKSRCLGNR